MTESVSLPPRPVPPRRLSWLRSELDDWTAQGLITEGQAARISTRYRPERHARPLLGGLLLRVGGAFVGTGLVWLVAANLDRLAPLTRFGLVAALWLLFLVGGEVLAHRRASPSVVGAARLLAALGLGAMVFQAAQSLQVPAFEPRLVGLWAAGALLHGYLTGAFAPFAVGVVTGVGWWLARPLWDEQTGLTVVVLLGAGAVLAAALAVVHDGRADRFARAWRTVAAGMALLAGFVAAVPGIGSDGIVWSTSLVLALAVAAAAAALAAVTRPGARILEPVGAIGVLLGAGALALWTTGADASDVGTADWLRAAVAVAAYAALAVGLVALGALRDHPALTWMATTALVVFTTFQSFAVFAPIVTGAWLFVVLGTVFLGTGFLFDRARRGLAQALEAPPTPSSPDTSTDAS
ncbi:DUF2157 domain-containing protein [Nocardioides renjunii]|uniref:DUF2157 domain-containing protein n=1 Tax=Nocardioides renjunii TaxID=3095075 RepID=UPI002AFEF012|nr:DUF2157 domain-containing protein [Nocardioides sp. S-34]WQQ23064.1 DUF2157 domain-containing protein [Nocardioides sp. S-34]